jgi:MFS transporter, SP family, general alpha glucoside:H+ symporter
VYTNNLEEELSVGTSYRDCFKGFELRRTEIACLTFMGQVMCGTPIAYNATYFYEQIGLESNKIYNLNIGGYALALGAAFCSWVFVMPHFGRRTTYLWGSFVMFTILYIIGILTSFKKIGDVAEAQAYLTLVWKTTYQLSSGQLGWAIPAEVGSTRLRQKTVVLGRNAYYILFVIGGVLQPYFMNPAAWNVGGRTGKSYPQAASMIYHASASCLKRPFH